MTYQKQTFWIKNTLFFKWLSVHGFLRTFVGRGTLENIWHEITKNVQKYISFIIDMFLLFICVSVECLTEPLTLELTDSGSGFITRIPWRQMGNVPTPDLKP